MGRGWLRYLICLVAALAFYIFYDGYFSYLAFYLTLLLPLISLALGLPGVFLLRADLGVQESGEWGKFHVSVTLKRRFPFPVFGARVTLRCENVFTSEMAHISVPPQRFDQQAASFLLETGRCGKIECRATLICRDPLGLFRLPVRSGGLAKSLLLPEESGPFEGEEKIRGEESAARTGTDPTAYTDPRPYRPGDSMRRVHWKLSARQNELQVKGDAANSPVLFFFLDLRGDVDERDGALRCFARAARLLSEDTEPFSVCYLRRGIPCVYAIDRDDGMVLLWEDLLSVPADSSDFDPPADLRMACDIPPESPLFRVSETGASLLEADGLTGGTP